MEGIQKLAEYLIDGCVLSYGLSPGCRCLACNEFQLRDIDNKVIVSDESLYGLLAKLEDVQ